MQFLLQRTIRNEPPSSLCGRYICFGIFSHRVAEWQCTIQIRKEFNEKEAAGAANATENSLSKSCKKWMSAACAKYDDVASINKVAEVQAKVTLTLKLHNSWIDNKHCQVDDVKMTMESNVKVRFLLLCFISRMYASILLWNSTHMEIWGCVG